MEARVWSLLQGQSKHFFFYFSSIINTLINRGRHRGNCTRWARGRLRNRERIRWWREHEKKGGGAVEVKSGGHSSRAAPRTVKRFSAAKHWKGSQCSVRPTAELESQRIVYFLLLKWHFYSFQEKLVAIDFMHFHLVQGWFFATFINMHEWNLNTTPTWFFF